jgi:hypothetical protein
MDETEAGRMKQITKGWQMSRDKLPVSQLFITCRNALRLVRVGFIEET